MKRAKKVRGKVVGVSYQPDEMESLRSLFARSMCRTLCDYVRKRSLNQPIAFVWRNRSFDGFVEEIVTLRRIMEELCERPDWSAAEKERLLAVHGEIQSVIDKIVSVCTPI